MHHRLGEFEQLVLLACLRLGGVAYTVAIIEDITRRTGRRPTHGHVFVALRRLEEKGLLESIVGPSTPAPGGRAKRFFRIRPAGVRALRDVRRALDRMWSGLTSRVSAR